MSGIVVVAPDNYLAGKSSIGDQRRTLPHPFALQCHCCLRCMHFFCLRLVMQPKHSTRCVLSTAPRVVAFYSTAAHSTQPAWLISSSSFPPTALPTFIDVRQRLPSAAPPASGTIIRIIERGRQGLCWVRKGLCRGLCRYKDYGDAHAPRNHRAHTVRTTLFATYGTRTSGHHHHQQSRPVLPFIAQQA